MCGLVGGVDVDVTEGVLALDHRGPDSSGITMQGPFHLGHTRLAIQDLSHASDQPFHSGQIMVTYNGELWRPEAARAYFGGDYRTTGDTEVVADALARYGHDALAHLHGMWALAWTDGGVLHLARDAYGEVPLHYGLADGKFVYASEVKALLAIGADPTSIQWVPPGMHLEIDTRSHVTGRRWVWPPDTRVTTADGTGLRDLLTVGATDRMTADVPVAVLVSGGLDSSAILALLVEAGYTPVGYTAVYDPKSYDLKCARIVTKHLDVPLVEVQVPDPTLADIGAAVWATETNFKAQNEIALGCLPLARALRADGFRVVLSGEGSDELWASYGFAYHRVKQWGWGPARWRAFSDQHRANFARTNKVFMAHGVEPRLPFLHDPLVRYALGLAPHVVAAGHPKEVLARAVEDLLPEKVVRRSKVGFQEGAGLREAAAAVVTDPARYYASQHTTLFKGART